MDPILNQPPAPAIHVEGLGCRRGGRQVLRDVDLYVVPGEVVGVLGRNGAGKSTLLRVLAGLQRIQAGEVRVSGHLAGSAAARRQIGWLPEAPVLPDARVLQVLLTAAPPDPVQDVVSELDLGLLLNTPCAALSLGQQRRVALALALVHRPTVLLLDEPLNALDGDATDRLVQGLQRRVASGMAVVATGHEPRDLAPLGPRLVRPFEGAPS